jgi:hypothetical protein
MAFKKATVSIDDWLKSTGATERPRAQQDAADAQKPVTKPISEPVPQKKKENISFWEKLLNAFGDAGYSGDTSAPLGMMNQAISDDYRSSGMQESKTAQAGGNIVKSAAKGAESAYESAVGAMMSKRSGTQIMGVTVADDAVSEADKATAEAARQRNQADMYAKAEAADTAAWEAREAAKDNLGGSAAAGALVDIASGGLQLGADMAVNALIPGAGLASMGVRAFGNGAREAMMDGASGGEQVIYGAAQAAVQIATEKMFDVGKLFGGGAADDVAEKLIQKLAKTDTGRSIVRALTNAVGEGAEEAVSDLLTPAIRAIYDSGKSAANSYTTAEGRKELLAQSAYDAMIGAALSTFGTTAGIMKGVDAQKNAALRAVEAGTNTDVQTGGKPAEASKIAAQAQAAAAAPAANVQAESAQDTVRAMLKKGVVSNKEANRILSDAQLRAAFEQQTGERLTGANSEQRAKVKSTVMLQNITGAAAKSEAQTQSTAINTDPQQHTPEQQARIQEYQSSVDSRILSFIHKWNGLKNADYKKRARVRLDTVSERAASDLKSTVGIDATGYRHSIDGNALQHIEKRHGTNGEADHSMANENDIARISYVLENYDSVKPLLNADGSQKLSSMFNNADNTPAPLVLYAKQIDGTYYAVEAAPDSSAHELRIVSAYMTNKNSGSAGKVLNMPPSGPQLTSEVPHRANASTTADSIPAVGKDVNPKTPEGQSQKTGEIVNERAENAVEAQNSGNFVDVQQREAETDAGQRGTLPEGQGAKSAEFGYDEAKTQARSLKNLFEKGDRKKLGLTEQDLSHKVEHDAEAEAKAQERFESDYEGEKADLFGAKRDWDKTDTALAYKIMDAELDKARESGSMDDYAEVARLVKRWHEQGTDVGQVMQQRQALSKSPKLMEAAAIELLMDEKRTRKMTAETRKELLDAVTENANRLSDIPEGDTAEVVSLIKDLSSIRKTNGIWFGNVERRMSKAMNGALDYAADMEGGEAFLREIAATQIVNIARDYALPSHIERVKTWRYLSMLSKPATALRNYAGNNVMNVVDATSQNCGVPLDMLLSRYTGVRSVAPDKGLAGKDRKKGADDAFIKAYIEIGLDADTSGSRSKMETKAGRTNKMTGNFIERLVSTFEKYNSYAMVATDQRQKGGIEAEAQRGIRELERAGKVNKGALGSRPQELAKERTFQNDSKIAQATSGARNALNVFSIKDKRGGSFGAGDLILPFTNVPGNIADMAIQYSPFGFIRAGAEVTKVVSKIKGAQLTAEEREGVQSKLNRAYKRAESGELTKEEHAALWRDVASVIRKSSGVELMPKQRDNLKKAVDQYLIHAQNGAKAQCEAAVSEMANLLAKAKAGALTAPEQAKAVTDFGRAFNGTMGIAFFAVLAGAGIMKVAGDDDKDKEALEKSEGVSGTQLNTSALVRLVSGGSAKWQDGDTLVSIGFLDPINAQMTYGALLADCYEDDGKITFGDVTRENLSSIYQSVMDLPAMSQIQEIENSLKYSKADTTGGKLADATLRYGASQATSFIPNIVSGVAQGIDGKVRDTYNGDTTGENAWRAVKNKTIFLRQTNPVALDSWGNEKTYGDSAFQNFMNATLNPGSVTKYRTDAVNQELYRLGEETEIKYPGRRAPTSANRGGKSVTLTEAERRKYQAAYGKTAHADIQKVISSAVYKQASDAEKAEAIRNLFSNATASAKKKTRLDGGDPPSWTAKSDGTVGENAVYKAMLGTAKDALPEDKRTKTGNVLQSVLKTAGSKRGGDNLMLNIMAQQLSEGTQDKFETAYNGGYELKQIVDFYQAKYAAKPGTNQRKYKKADLYAWAMQNGYTAKQFNQLWKLFS